MWRQYLFLRLGTLTWVRVNILSADIFGMRKSVCLRKVSAYERLKMQRHMLLRPLLSASMLQKLINCMGFELQYKCTLTYWSQCNCPQLLLPVNNECLSLQTCIYKVLLIEELLAVAITVTKYNIVTAPAETKIKHSMLAKCKFDFLYKLY